MRCDHCYYYREIIGPEDEYEGWGRCHRFPPVLQPSLEEPNNRDDDTFLPTETCASGWCGEFKKIGVGF